MTEKYKDLRDALAAGPKPGKWTWKQVGSFSTPGYAVLWPDTSKGGTHYRRIDSGGGMEQVDADYIAAANPETICALLAERDALREALKDCAAVCAGETFSKSGLVRALELARAALAQEQGGKE